MKRKLTLWCGAVLWLESLDSIMWWFVNTSGCTSRGIYDKQLVIFALSLEEFGIALRSTDLMMTRLASNNLGERCCVSRSAHGSWHMRHDLLVAVYCYQFGA